MIQPFSLHVSEAVLDDLRARIRQSRWPDAIPGVGWDQGTDPAYLRDLLGYWADGFDWRAQEAYLNSFQNFRADIEGLSLHFVRANASSGPGIPIILTHGWPSSFIEMLPLVPYLTDPAAHGITGPTFDVVIPSLPGYPFSDRPARAITTRDTARLWHRLMHEIGYQRYAAGGTDFGSAVTTYMALDDPESLIGIHLTNLDIPPYTGPGSLPITQAERDYLEQVAQWDAVERGYSAIQSTKPQTLAYALNDSPAGLAAWIIEKWRSWSDTKGDLESRYSRDFLLTNITLYWIGQGIATSIRDYYDNRWFGSTAGRDDFVHVPTAIAVFANMFVPEGEPSRAWAERMYNVQRWTVMPRGGHFAAAEEPELTARDICAFFGGG